MQGIIALSLFDIWPSVEIRDMLHETNAILVLWEMRTHCTDRAITLALLGIGHVISIMGSLFGPLGDEDMYTWS